MSVMTSPDSMPLFVETGDGYDVSLFSMFGERFMDLLIREPGWDLLDVGAGRGAVAAAAAARGFTVTATDAAPGMVTNLRVRHPEVNAIVMDPHRLDFKDSSFDIATASFVIDVVDDAAQCFREVCRVVRPGGLVAMAVPAALSEAGPTDVVPGPTDVVAAFSRAGLVDLREERIEVALPPGEGGQFRHHRADVHLGRVARPTSGVGGVS